MITLTNFWEFTFGVWDELDFSPEHAACKLIYTSEDGSKYYTDNVEHSEGIRIYRVSNHWGGGIGTCNWYLNGYEPCNSFTFKEDNDGADFVGCILLSELQEMNIPKKWWISNHEYKGEKEEDRINYEYTCKDD